MSHTSSALYGHGGNTSLPLVWYSGRDLQLELTRIVKAAYKRKAVKLVLLSWLEDSLLARGRKPLPTFKYDHRQRHWHRKNAKKVKSNEDDDNGQLYLPADVRQLDDKLVKIKTIEEAGWDIYDLYIWRLILDRRQIRQGM